MRYLGIEFEEVRYGQGGRECRQQQLCGYHVSCATYLECVYLFDSANWQEAKENLGMPFPNVSNVWLCCMLKELFNYVCVCTSIHALAFACILLAHVLLLLVATDFIVFFICSCRISLMVT